MTKDEKNLRLRQDLRTQSLRIQMRAGNAWYTLNDDRWLGVICRINVALANNQFTKARQHIRALETIVEAAANRLQRSST